MTGLFQEVRFALRQLRKSPGFTAVAVITLALGTGANTAIFSVVNSVLLRNLPVRDPQQLVFLTNPNEQGMGQGFEDGDRDLLTYWEFQQLEGNNPVFSGLLASSSFAQSLPIKIEDLGESQQQLPEHVSLVSGSYFSVLGINPILGRTFTTEVDKVRDANPVAVISYGFWRDHFAGSAAVLGRSIRIHDTSFTIIGVIPRQFRGETVGVSPEIWVPLSMQAEIYPGRDYLSLETQPFHKTEWLHAIGRLKPGVTLAQAKASINVEFQQLMESQTAGMSADRKRQFLNQHLAVVEPNNAEQASKRLTQEPTRRVIGRAVADGTVRANEDHQTCRGNGDGKQAKLTSSNTGSPSGDRSRINRRLARVRSGRMGWRRGS